MDAVALMGRIVKETAARTADHGTASAAPSWWSSANAVEDNPFMAGAFHGVGEPEMRASTWASPAPAWCTTPLQSVKGRAAVTWWPRPSKRPRPGDPHGPAGGPGERQPPSGRTPFGIVDLSLAPTPPSGDSVARILEEMGLEVCGTHGTTALPWLMLNDAVKKGGVMASYHPWAACPARFIPVSPRTRA